MKNKKINVDTTIHVVSKGNDLAEKVCENVVDTDTFIYISNSVIGCNASILELNMLLGSLYEEYSKRLGNDFLDNFIYFVKCKKHEESEEDYDD